MHVYKYQSWKKKNPRIGKEDDNRQFFKVVVEDYL